jgi:hypothetical protein
VTRLATDEYKDNTEMVIGAADDLWMFQILLSVAPGQIQP